MSDLRQPGDLDAGYGSRPGGRTWLAVLTLLFLLGIALFAFYRSALFRLESLDLQGANRLTKEQVLETAGLTYGMGRWQLSGAAIEQRLLAEPWVKAVKARWEWNRLTVAVLERQPVGLLHYHDIYYLLLDESGVILELGQLAEHQGVPVISGHSEVSAVRGKVLDDKVLADALTVLSRMPTTLRSEVSEAAIAPDGHLTLFMAGGATVYWGLVPEGRNRIAAVDSKVDDLVLLWFEHVKRRAGCEIDLQPAPRSTIAGCD